ncbi:CPBP family intramembrane metalloprotease [Natronorubrum sp. JWXQ-INN-674]|uniref:CPBP family intramembrane metalloprotease n=1 Tax=Natronorubrum halalkaliphilum TaxID=2691917 RepID=A0A6B0VPC0_9EURY|nr:type II CAAX endopeptidase family protein [Natronorubrum halalkaliphilum]MXV63003.1 CPBP family intramembrane metalloprotease [Natronorubrum halalkaliphilum]
MTRDEGASPQERESIETGRRPLIVFFGSLVALSSGFVVVAQLTAVSMIALAPAYMFTPMIAGIVTCIVGSPSFEAAGLRFPHGRLRWLGIAAAAPIVLVLIGTGVALLVPGVEFVPDANPLTGEGTEFAQTDEPAGPSLPGWPFNLLVTIGVALGIGATINAVFAFGEEFGWRGVLLTILAPLGFWKASAVIGLFWGVWHAPIILEGYNFPNNPVLGVGVMTVACIAMSPVYTYVTVAAKSVLAPAIFHGTFNAFAAVTIVFAQGGSELVVNAVGGIGILVFGLASILIAVGGPPRLATDWALQEGIDGDGDGDTRTDTNTDTDSSPEGLEDSSTND